MNNEFDIHKLAESTSDILSRGRTNVKLHKSLVDTPYDSIREAAVPPPQVTPLAEYRARIDKVREELQGVYTDMVKDLNILNTWLSKSDTNSPKWDNYDVSLDDWAQEVSENVHGLKILKTYKF